LEKISILIVDDHALIREAWSSILTNDPRFDVIATCDNAEEAVAQVKEKRPNVILMDINMAPFSGLDATQQILRISPDSKIVGLSVYSEPAYATKMLQMGGSGYVTKNSSREEMIKAIIDVNNGNKYLCDEIKNNISRRSMEDNPGPKLDSLTKREIQIINLLKNGFSSKEIAASLQIAHPTVEAHRHNILKKLKLKNTATLVSFIYKNPDLI
jgi:DNA-binding NarL/FixJ family response regulator